MQENTNTSPQSPKETEIDLGVFFILIGRIFRKLAGLIKAFFIAIYTCIIFLLLFIKRCLLWLALGALVGAGVGLYLNSRGSSYFSEMIVRSNFESSRLLYNQIDYYNSLINQGRNQELAAVFNIKKEMADDLVRFEISPVDDDLEIAKLYRNTFLDYRRNSINGVDTQWTRVMKFAEFKKNLNSYDFPLQKITLYSSTPDVYTSVQQGIVKAVASNTALQAIRNKTNKIYTDEENMLLRSLSGIDSLRKAYNTRILESVTASKTEGNNVIVSDKDMRNPEIDLYDKELMIKDELAISRKRAIDQADILQVYSDFNPSGTKESGFRKYILRFALFGLITAFGIILLIELYKYLNLVEQKKRTFIN